MVNINGALLPSPFNFKAIDMLYPENEADFLKKALLHEYPRQNMVTIVTLLKSEVPQIRKFAELLFELDYRPYTAKQWGISPEEIDVSVLQRVPIILSYENSYFDDPYQCMPKYGFTYFFKDLLNHPNIKILINTDANKLIHLHENSVSVDGFDTDVTVVYTGAIDEFLNYRFGHLPYRSLIFKYQDKDVDSFQPVPVVSDPKAVGYTRITEYKKLPVQICDEKTVIAVEYPVAYHSEHTAELEPYYPIITNDNQKLYEKYAKALKSVKNLYLCGRLANYKYYNMDQAIIRAFEVFDEISKRNVG
jgi:UDP-galactopyranose mutase